MKEFIVNNFNISEKDAGLFSDSFDEIVLNKGDKFIEYGRITNKIGFVKKGLLKCIIIGSRKNVVDDFAFEGQFVTNYYSFLKREKSNKDIVCLSSCVLKVITRKKIEELSEKHSFIQHLARLMSEQLFISTAKKLEDLRLLSAEERYLDLVRINEKIVTKIPQYEIASYLNVTPETISRIRNRLTIRS